MKSIGHAAASFLCIASIAAQAQDPVVAERPIEQKPSLVLGPPAVIDSSGNPVTAAGRIVTSRSAYPLAKDAVIVSPRGR